MDHFSVLETQIRSLLNRLNASEKENHDLKTERVELKKAISAMDDDLAEAKLTLEKQGREIEDFEKVARHLVQVRSRLHQILAKFESLLEDE